jgi:hypothetical protein
VISIQSKNAKNKDWPCPLFAGFQIFGSILSVAFCACPKLLAQINTAVPGAWLSSHVKFLLWARWPNLWPKVERVHLSSPSFPAHSSPVHLAFPDDF